jgi:hypothetical protein
MFQRDYILRMIEQAAQAIARAMRMFREQKQDEAEQQLASGYAALGLDPELLGILDAASLRAQWGDEEMLAMASRLLLCDAELRQGAGDRALAQRRFKTARKLKGLLSTPQDDLDAELDRVAQLLDSR